MRIVAGLARGRRLASPAAGTRPTSDRAREGLFNTLAARMRLEDARVLDLFAGTGAVGLEALSRGAQAAVFVEKGRQALTVLRENIATVGLPGAVVISRPVAQHLAGSPDHPFDLVFADPPYALPDEKVWATMAQLVVNGWLAQDAFLVVERSTHSTAGAFATDWLTPAGEKRYGDSVLWYGRRR